jgi:hypothetical protein
MSDGSTCTLLQDFEGHFAFQATWKDTFVHMHLLQPHTMPPAAPHSLITDGSSQCTTSVHSSRPEKPPTVPSIRKRNRIAAESCASDNLAAQSSVLPRQEKRLNIDHFYSDLLYQSHLCATSEIHSRWLEGDNLPHVKVATLTQATFREQYEKPNVPVVLTGCKEFELARQKWDCAYMKESLKGRDIIAGMFLSRCGKYWCILNASHR